MIDIAHQISSVRREVGSRTIEAGEARTTVISRSYDTTVEDLWDACTNPERIPRWFLPVSGDLRLHGRYQLEGNAGGVIEQCDPPKSFAATWEFGDQTSWIEVRFTPEPDDRARLVLEHIALVEDELWDQFGPGAVGIGWDLAVIGLTLHLESGEAVDAAAFQEWSASGEGRAFAVASSEGWRDASIAAGTDPAAAHAAADRVTGFYTEAPSEEDDDGDTGAPDA
jgi:uncharacterized protein YndB with AHSA1/START domain